LERALNTNADRELGLDDPGRCCAWLLPAPSAQDPETESPDPDGVNGTPSNGDGEAVDGDAARADGGWLTASTLVRGSTNTVLETHARDWDWDSERGLDEHDGEAADADTARAAGVWLTTSSFSSLWHLRSKGTIPTVRRSVPGHPPHFVQGTSPASGITPFPCTWPLKDASALDLALSIWIEERPFSDRALGDSAAE